MILLLFSYSLHKKKVSSVMSESEDYSSVKKFVKKYEIIIFYLITLFINWTGWFMLDSILIPLVDSGANLEQLIFEKDLKFLR